MSSKRDKSVHFSSKVETKTIDNDAGGPVKKKARLDRPNEDEIDDVDDWVEEEEEDGDGEGTVPSMKERLRAKAKRRNREHGVEDEADEDEQGGIESTNIDEKTSLAAEGFTIEPFHMKQEQSDGTGFFDGDTYVFRKRGDDEEPDAWLESLKETNADAANGKSDDDDDDLDTSDQENGDDTEGGSKEEWCAKILNLVSDTETIMQAVIRYGQLLKRHQPVNRNNKKKGQQKKQENGDDSNESSEAYQFAQTSLNDLTEAANALLGLGIVDIYDKTRTDLLKWLPNKEEQTVVDATKPNATQKVSWEYKGSEDNKLHGPYTTEQMRAWIQAGYFVGPQAVQIRTIKQQEKETVQDLLSDLMDDDDEDDGGGANESANGGGVVKGEWRLSDSVDFEAYA